MAEAPPWGLFSLEYSHQEQNIFDYRGQLVSPKTPARGQLFINSVTLYAYDAADDINNDNYATLLESFVITPSLWVAQVNTKKVSGLNHLVLVKKWGISPKKALNTIHCTTQCHVCTLTYSCLGSSGEMIFSYGTEHYQIMCKVINCLPLQCLGEEIGAHKLSTNFGWSHSFPMKLKNEAQKALARWSATINDMLQCQRYDSWRV